MSHLDKWGSPRVHSRAQGKKERPKQDRLRHRGRWFQVAKSLLTAGRIRLWEWGSTCWAAGGIQVDPDVGGTEENRQSGKSWHQQLLDWHFLTLQTVSLKLCRHSLKPVSSRGSRFTHAHCTAIPKYKTTECSVSFFIAIHCSVTLSSMTATLTALQIRRYLLQEHWKFWNMCNTPWLGTCIWDLGSAD